MRFKPFQAPRELKFKDPDTGFVFRSNSRAQLIKHIISYRIQNRLDPIEFLDAVIDNYLCGLPENKGLCRGMPLKRGILASVKGGIKLLKQFAYSKFAPQAVADKRSDICVKCKYNVFPDRGPFIKWADDVALHTIGSRKSKNHAKLGNCEVCSCPMRAKVFYEGTLEIPEDQLKKMNEVGCWQPALTQTQV